MKRTVSFLLTALLLLSLAACGGKGTWQEQYDLGMRYLNEGNYQEAVIAFETAIKIDPKRPEAYLGAAEAYVGLGDYVSARKILEDGLKNTEDQEIRKKLDELDTQHPAATMGYNPTPFTARENHHEFSSLSGSQQTLLRALMAAATLNDGITTVDTSWTEFSDNIEVYTELDGYRMRVKQSINESQHGCYRELEFDMRPENGMGYLYVLDQDDFYDPANEGTAVSVGSLGCLCTSWLWNGEFHRYRTVTQDMGGVHGTGEWWEDGMVEYGWRVGTFHSKSISKNENMPQEAVNEISETYEKGEAAIFHWFTDWRAVLGDAGDRATADRLYW